MDRRLVGPRWLHDGARVMAETTCVEEMEARVSGPLHSIVYQSGIYRVEFEAGGAIALDADDIIGILAKHFSPEKAVHHDSGGS